MLHKTVFEPLDLFKVVSAASVYQFCHNCSTNFATSVLPALLHLLDQFCHIRSTNVDTSVIPTLPHLFHQFCHIHCRGKSSHSRDKSFAQTMFDSLAFLTFLNFWSLLPVCVSQRVWPDGWIIFQSSPIYSKWKFAQQHKNSQSRHKSLSNKK